MKHKSLILISLYLTFPFNIFANSATTPLWFIVILAIYGINVFLVSGNYVSADNNVIIICVWFLAYISSFYNGLFLSVDLNALKKSRHKTFVVPSHIVNTYASLNIIGI